MKKIIIVIIVSGGIFIILITAMITAIIASILGVDEMSEIGNEDGDMFVEEICISGTAKKSKVDLIATGSGFIIKGIKGDLKGNSFTAKNDIKAGAEMPLPKKPAKLSGHSWMPQFDQSLYSFSLDRNSPQFKLNMGCTTDSSGFRKKEGAYLVALGSFYGSKIGTRYTIKFKQKDGTTKTITAILGDQKADNHTDSNCQYHKSDKSVLEFIMGARSSKNSRAVGQFGTIVSISKSDMSIMLNGDLKGEKVDITGTLDSYPLIASGTINLRNGKLKANGTYGNISGNYTGGKILWPVPNNTKITSGFGWRTCPYHGKEFHAAIDIGAPKGADIIACASGKVIESKINGGFGKYIMIDHGNGFYTSYAHASKLLVKKGVSVSVGQVIAKVGSTGNSTGPHLDFRVYNGGSTKEHTVNPMMYLGGKN